MIAYVEPTGGKECDQLSDVIVEAVLPVLLGEGLDEEYIPQCSLYRLEVPSTESESTS